MCNPASFIITKGHRLYWSEKSDSHTIIREEHNIKEEKDIFRDPISVAVELSPKNIRNIATESPDKWIFRIDQDIIPSWFDRRKAEEIVRRNIQNWINDRFVDPFETIQGTYHSDKIIVPPKINKESKIYHNPTDSDYSFFDNSKILTFYPCNISLYDISNLIIYTDNIRLLSYKNSKTINQPCYTCSHIDLYDSAQFTHINDGHNSNTKCKITLHDYSCLETQYNLLDAELYDTSQLSLLYNNSSNIDRKVKLYDSSNAIIRGKCTLKMYNNSLATYYLYNIDDINSSHIELNDNSVLDMAIEYNVWNNLDKEDKLKLIKKLFTINDKSQVIVNDTDFFQLDIVHK